MTALHKRRAHKSRYAVEDTKKRRAGARSGRPRGLRVGSVLLLVAIVPLVGMGAVTWDRIEHARSAHAAALHTQAVADEAVSLARLDGAVFDELVASAISNVAEELDAAPELLSAFLGTDPARDLETAHANTDTLVVLTGRKDVADAIAAARAAESGLSGTLARYRNIMNTIESSLAVAMADLSNTTSGSNDTGDLPPSARVLEHAIDARSAVAEEFYGYFATIFDLRDAPRVELQRLIRSRAKYEAAVSALAAADDDRIELRAGVDQLTSDPGVVGLNDAIDTLVANSLTTGLPAQAAPLSLDIVVQNLDGFAAVYEAARASSATTVRLLDAAASTVLTAADDAKSVADRNIDRAYVFALLLTATTLITALLAARSIVRPLRGLKRAAQGLQSTAEMPPVELVGPAEVRAAAGAIQDAARHFDLVTRQTRALAAGDLNAQVLDEPAPGGLGTAVQHAVGTLRSALAQQDEFRRRLAHEATHDGLTNLANRNASMAQLTRSLARTTRSGSQLALLFIDLDRFKNVNDHHGHHAGDTVLTAVAQRLVNAVREGDHVGRLGGDEFVVVAEPVSNVDEAVALAQRLLDTIAEPIAIGSERVTVGASIGIAFADGADLTADELLRDADLAVYRAKSIGRGGLAICDEDIRNEVAETADLSLALRKAIEHDDLVVHYQPIIDTQTNEVSAFEALVRWQRDGHDGLVPPDKFIGFAERSSLIIDLDRWVIAAVARQIQSWHAEGLYADTSVAINVSRRHLAHDQFEQHVLQPLAECGIDPHSIIIEVTESALLDDLAGAAVKLQRLRDAGVLVAIDDFGTGYTSLAHLRSLPVDILKIDRSFTVNAATDPHEASIVKLIIDTGHLLGATITAEGVETVHEADTLTELGSDSLQGFYFARPQPANQLVCGASQR